MPSFLRFWLLPKYFYGMIDSIRILNLGFLHQIAKMVFYMELKRLQTAKLVNISKANRNSLAYKARRAIYELFKVGRPISVLRVANWTAIQRLELWLNIIRTTKRDIFLFLKICQKRYRKRKKMIFVYC